MGVSRGEGFRAGTLAAVGGAAALATGLIGGRGPDDGFLLATAGAFALGIAAALGVTEVGADGGRSERASRPSPVDPGSPPRRSERQAPELPDSAGASVPRATVAAVAHDMSNPLASLRSNLAWLGDALEEGRLDEPEEQEEAREVLRDAREAAERLRADVGALRAAGRGEATGIWPS